MPGRRRVFEYLVKDSFDQGMYTGEEVDGALRKFLDDYEGLDVQLSGRSLPGLRGLREQLLSKNVLYKKNTVAGERFFVHPAYLMLPEDVEVPLFGDVQAVVPKSYTTRMKRMGAAVAALLAVGATVQAASSTAGLYRQDSQLKKLAGQSDPLRLASHGFTKDELDFDSATDEYVVSDDAAVMLFKDKGMAEVLEAARQSFEEQDRDSDYSVDIDGRVFDGVYLEGIGGVVETPSGARRWLFRNLLGWKSAPAGAHASVFVGSEGSDTVLIYTVGPDMDSSRQRFKDVLGYVPGEDAQISLELEARQRLEEEKTAAEEAALEARQKLEEVGTPSDRERQLLVENAMMRFEDFMGISPDTADAGKAVFRTEGLELTYIPIGDFDKTVSAEEAALSDLKSEEYSLEVKGRAFSGTFLEGGDDGGTSSVFVGKDGDEVVVIKKSGADEYESMTSFVSAVNRMGSASSMKLLEELDSDGDGLTDLSEVSGVTDRLKADSDGDGYKDSIDKHPGEDDYKYEDDDGDRLLNHEEQAAGTDLKKADSDGDGLSDYEELKDKKTDPLKADTDGDGIIDSEDADPLVHIDDMTDSDGDGWVDSEEDRHGTDRHNPDTDGDGLKDPEDPSPTMVDSDNDMLSDADEVKLYGSDPLNIDSDGDGLVDPAEVELGTDPASLDSDGDRRKDSVDDLPLFNPSRDKTFTEKWSLRQMKMNFVGMTDIDTDGRYEYIFWVRDPHVKTKVLVVDDNGSTRFKLDMHPIRVSTGGRLFVIEDVKGDKHVVNSTGDEVELFRWGKKPAFETEEVSFEPYVYSPPRIEVPEPALGELGDEEQKDYIDRVKRNIRHDEENIIHISSCDLNGDGVPEVAVSSTGYDTYGCWKWYSWTDDEGEKHTEKEYGTCRDFEKAYVHVFSGSDMTRLSFNHFVGILNALDVDTDGKRELLLGIDGLDVYSLVGSGRDMTLQRDWKVDFSSDAVITRDINGNGLNEVLLLSGDYCGYRSPLSWRYTCDITTLDRKGRELFSLPEVLSMDDINRDSELDIITRTAIYDPEGAAQMKTFTVDSAGRKLSGRLTLLYADKDLNVIRPFRSASSHTGESMFVLYEENPKRNVTSADVKQKNREYLVEIGKRAELLRAAEELAEQLDETPAPAQPPTTTTMPAPVKELEEEGWLSKIPLLGRLFD